MEDTQTARPNCLCVQTLFTFLYELRPSTIGNSMLSRLELLAKEKV